MAGLLQSRLLHPANKNAVKLNCFLAIAQPVMHNF